MRILIIGNSEALFVRPPRKKKNEGTYTEILIKELKNAQIFNLSSGSSLVTDLLNSFDKNLNRYFPDIVILHFGINEAAPRLLPRFIWNLIYADKNKYTLMSFSKSLIKFLRKFFSLITFLYLKSVGGKDKGWVSCRKFEYVYSQLISRIEKELKSTIIIINIGFQNKKLEKTLPGIVDNIKMFNDIMAKIARRSESVFLVDVYEMCKKFGMDRIRPDGVHFSSEGHRFLANEIVALIQRISNI
jgi:lysophospholipase L1-like esterase